MKICRHCGTPDQTAMKRPGSYTVLCAECHLDVTSGKGSTANVAPGPVTRAWTPRETGVLKYNPFKVQMQGGGR